MAHVTVSHLICPYMTPRVLVSNNGTEFKNQVIRDICPQLHIQQTFIKSHHPASNGLVECTNRKILEILRHLAGHLQETWEDWLSHVAASINGSVNLSKGKTPHYILYEFEKHLPYNVLVHPPVPLYSLDDCSKLQLHCFQTIYKSVWEKLNVSWEEMLQKQHSQATPVHLDVGDPIMKRAPNRSCKLTPKLSGSYLLTAKLHSNKFKLLDPSTNISEVVHVDSFKVSTSFTPAAVPSPSSPTDLPSPPDTLPSHSYRFQTAECHWSVSSISPLFSLTRIFFALVFFWGCPPWVHILFLGLMPSFFVIRGFNFVLSCVCNVPYYFIPFVVLSM